MVIRCSTTYDARTHARISLLASHSLTAHARSFGSAWLACFTTRTFLSNTSCERNATCGNKSRIHWLRGRECFGCAKGAGGSPEWQSARSAAERSTCPGPPPSALTRPGVNASQIGDNHAKRFYSVTALAAKCFLTTEQESAATRDATRPSVAQPVLSARHRTTPITTLESSCLFPLLRCLDPRKEVDGARRSPQAPRLVSLPPRFAP